MKDTNSHVCQTFIYNVMLIKYNSLNLILIGGPNIFGFVPT